MNPTKRSSAGAALPFYFTVAAAAALAALQIYIMLNLYEAEVHLYLAGTALPVVWGAALVVLCAAAAIWAAFSQKKSAEAQTLPKINFTASFFGAMTAFLLFALTLFGALEYVREPKPFAMPVLFDTVRLALALPAGIYFFILASEKKPKRLNPAVFGFFAVLWCAMHLMTLYFDMTTPLNSPPRILRQLAFIAAMLFLLYEVRYPMGMAQPSRYRAAAAATVVIMAPSAASSAVIIYFGLFPLSSSAIGAAIQFTLLGYALSRLASLSFPNREEIPLKEAE